MTQQSFPKFGLVSVLRECRNFNSLLSLRNVWTSPHSTAIFFCVSLNSVVTIIWRAFYIFFITFYAFINNLNCSDEICPTWDALLVGVNFSGRLSVLTFLSICLLSVTEFTRTTKTSDKALHGFMRNWRTNLQANDKCSSLTQTSREGDDEWILGGPPATSRHG